MSDVKPRAGDNDRSGFAETVAQQHPHGGRPGGRKEVGNAASSSLHPPHITENDLAMPFQAAHGNPAPVPALGANASGSDTLTTAEHDRGIDRTSMYDRRPEEDADQPPSERGD